MRNVQELNWYITEHENINLDAVYQHQWMFWWTIVESSLQLFSPRPLRFCYLCFQQVLTSELPHFNKKFVDSWHPSRIWHLFAAQNQGACHWALASPNLVTLSLLSMNYNSSVRVKGNTKWIWRRKRQDSTTLGLVTRFSTEPVRWAGEYI